METEEHKQRKSESLEMDTAIPVKCAALVSVFTSQEDSSFLANMSICPKFFSLIFPNKQDWKPSSN